MTRVMTVLSVRDEPGPLPHSPPAGHAVTLVDARGDLLTLRVDDAAGFAPMSSVVVIVKTGEPA